jgi:hypothetical protein
MKKYRNHNDDNFDEHGLLKDGHVYRPPGGLMMMDSDSARDRRIAALIDARHAHGDRGAMRITDAAGNDGLALHRPGYRCLLQDTAGRQAVADELQRAHDAYERDLTTAWRRGAGKEDVVPDAPRALSNDAVPVDDIETAYRLYAEEISQAWKTPR